MPPGSRKCSVSRSFYETLSRRRSSMVVSTSKKYEPLLAIVVQHYVDVRVRSNDTIHVPGLHLEAHPFQIDTEFQSRILFADRWNVLVPFWRSIVAPRHLSYSFPVAISVHRLGRSSIRREWPSSFGWCLWFYSEDRWLFSLMRAYRLCRRRLSSRDVQSIEWLVRQWDPFPMTVLLLSTSVVRARNHPCLLILVAWAYQQYLFEFLHDHFRSIIFSVEKSNACWVIGIFENLF